MTVMDTEKHDCLVELYRSGIWKRGLPENLADVDYKRARRLMLVIDDVAGLEYMDHGEYAQYAAEVWREFTRRSLKEFVAYEEQLEDEYESSLDDGMLPCAPVETQCSSMASAGERCEA